VHKTQKNRSFVRGQRYRTYMVTTEVTNNSAGLHILMEFLPCVIVIIQVSLGILRHFYFFLKQTGGTVVGRRKKKKNGELRVRCRFLRSR
jgi:hypothetical protein